MSRLLAILLCLAVLPAVAQSRIVPAQPSAFDPVVLRMTVDSCTFAPATVRVAAEAGVLRLTQQPNACLLPGPAEVVDVRLGTLPPGDYRVEVHATPRPGADPAERLAFTVAERAEVAVFPPPPRPLDDHSGLWWNPRESGWGLSLHQSPGHGLFGAWFVYGRGGEPEWYSVQMGQWTRSTTWTGLLFRTTGPFHGDPGFDPRLVLVRPAGTVELDFRQAPGEEGRARFTTTIDGVRTTRVIERQPF